MDAEDHLSHASCASDVPSLKCSPPPPLLPAHHTSASLLTCPPLLPLPPPLAVTPLLSPHPRRVSLPCAPFFLLCPYSPCHSPAPTPPRPPLAQTSGTAAATLHSLVKLNPLGLGTSSAQENIRSEHVDRSLRCRTSLNFFLVCLAASGERVRSVARVQLRVLFGAKHVQQRATSRARDDFCSSFFFDSVVSRYLAQKGMGRSRGHRGPPLTR